LEKIADTTLHFDPTAAEAAEIGLDASKSFYAGLKERCETLGIVNIRTIKKIERLATRFEEELAGFDGRVLGQAIHSLALFTFAKLQPADAPTTDFISNLNTYEALKAKEEGTEPERAPQWRALLSQYGFLMFDEFDAVVLRVVEEGHFDFEILKAEGS